MRIVTKMVAVVAAVTTVLLLWLTRDQSSKDKRNVFISACEAAGGTVVSVSASVSEGNGITRSVLECHPDEGQQGTGVKPSI